MDDGISWRFVSSFAFLVFVFSKSDTQYHIPFTQRGVKADDL